VTKRNKVLPIYLHHGKERFSYSFVDPKNGWWGRPLLPEILGLSWPRCSENADFQSMFAHKAIFVITVFSSLFYVFSTILVNKDDYQGRLYCFCLLCATILCGE